MAAEKWGIWGEVVTEIIVGNFSRGFRKCKRSGKLYVNTEEVR